MSLLSWNCQGAGSTETVQRLRELRRTYFPDFLFLMETKQRFDYMEGLKISLGYDELVTVEPRGLSGGLTLMWKHSYKVDVLSTNSRIIDLKVSMGSLVFFLTCVYGDPVRERRHIVWEQLCNIGLGRDEPWCLCGDFNELLNHDEKLGGPIRNENTFWGFRNMVENCKIKDIRYIGNRFSWAGWRDRIWVQCRLDRCFGNDEWFHLFPRAQIEYLAPWGSDHRPVLLSFALENEGSSKGRFYFDKRMLDKEGFEEAVVKGWELPNDNQGTVIDRITNCRRELAKWKKGSDLNSKSRILRFQKFLDNEISKAHPNRYFMKMFKQELAKAYKEEEIFWREKSREQWLKEGDRNTPYFQNCVKGKKIRNKVLMLLDDAGRELFSEGAKGNLAVDYFRELFTSTNPYDLDSLFHGLQPRVSQSMNTLLTAPVSPDEIKHAAFAVKGCSAPGADGLTGIFYQKCWHIVGAALISEIQTFFATGSLPAGWNHTHLSLLPKVPNPTKMTEMRPISLCSVKYKIISKILCDRLKLCLPSLISNTQGAFVSGRLISDNILIAHEMVHGLRTTDSVAQQFMAIKTDMSKAYDRVEWSFLEVLMEKLGFERKWISWIMSCITSVTYSVLLNGRTHGYIKPERGIRQGDPLSPFLFIMAAEALVNCLNTSEESGRLHGIRLGTTGPSVHHLLFADDSLLMCRATEEEAKEITRCLGLYGEASGQRINFAKSSIIFGSKVKEEVKGKIKEALCIEKEGGEGTYLGLPECFSRSKRKLLNYIQEKLQGRVNGWFSKALSTGGKEILIKSIALALPVYAMSCFRLPKGLCEKLTSVMTQYWWSSGDNKKKISWVAWKKLCRPKADGGLGFHDIEKFNQALLCKQAWRILEQPNSLLSQILQHRYFKKTSFLDCSVGTRPSYAWRSIIHGRELLKKGLIKSIGNGENTKFWLESWIMDTVPRPPVYKVDAVVDLTLTVSDFIIRGTNLWNIQALQEVVQDTDIPKILVMTPTQLRPDALIWGFSNSGLYTCKSGYKLLDSLQQAQAPNDQVLGPLEKQLWKKLWKSKSPPKLTHFIWKSLAGALAVKDRLASRRIAVDTTCGLCGHAQETICHVLFHCAPAREVWTRSGLTLPPHGFSPTSVFLNMFHLICGKHNPTIPLTTRLAYPWILWQLWKARNAFQFENSRLNPAAILDKATEDAETWLRLNNHIPQTTVIAPVPGSQTGWQKPLPGILKCNIGSSWSSADINVGSSWIVRNHEGATLFHSRTSYTNVSSEVEAELLSVSWAVESAASLRLDRIIFEASLPLAREALLHPDLFPLLRGLINTIQANLSRICYWSLEHTSLRRNRAASMIARSVTRDHRYRSYVARNGPPWMQHVLLWDASSPS